MNQRFRLNLDLTGLKRSGRAAMGLKSSLRSGLLFAVMVISVPFMALASEQTLHITAGAGLAPLVKAFLLDFDRQNPSLATKLHTRKMVDLTPIDAAGADLLIWLEPPGMSAGPATVIAGAPQVIARKRLAIWSANRNVRHMTAANLLAPEFRRVAIPDPASSRAGRAARQALKRAGVWGPLHGRLVLAETPRKTAELIRSGAVDAGLVEMPVIIDSGSQGSFAPLPRAYGTSAELRLGLTGRGGRKPAAINLISFMLSAQAQAIISRHGYSAP